MTRCNVEVAQACAMFQRLRQARRALLVQVVIIEVKVLQLREVRKRFTEQLCGWNIDCAIVTAELLQICKAGRCRGDEYHVRLGLQSRRDGEILNAAPALCGLDATIDKLCTVVQEVHCCFILQTLQTLPALKQV